MRLKVGIIGCGLIGKKRADAIERTRHDGEENADILVCCCDINEELAKNMAEKYNCRYYTNYKDMLNEDIDVAIVAVVNKYSKEIASAFLKLDKYVLIEKPMGRNYEEASELHSISNKIKVGFNLRAHPSIKFAKQILNDGSIGPILFMRAHYGHGGREGMEKEWRASKDLCGGGELLDQGVHLIDLFHWFAGEIKMVYGRVSTKYWNMEVEDTAIVQMVAGQNIDIQMIASWTTWKNTFSLEIYGEYGFIKVNGLGGSYGTETIDFGIQMKKGEVPKIKTITYEQDFSWINEWSDFKYSIQGKKDFCGNGYDGMMANKVIDAIYESSKKNEVVYL